MFLKSFSLVYCNFYKSCLRIPKCQISSPKIHAAASNALRTHFNITSSKIVKKCQQVSRSQSLLQHTWLASQQSEISVFTGARKKRFLSFERKTGVPEQTSFKIVLVLLTSSETRGLKMTCQGLSPLDYSNTWVQSPHAEHSCTSQVVAPKPSLSSQ